MRKEDKKSSKGLYLILILVGILIIGLFFVGISINGNVINGFGSKIVGFTLFDLIRDFIFGGKVMLGPTTGDTVELVVEGINCTGKIVSFEYYEVDSDGNDLITGLYGLPTSGTVLGSNVTATWLVQWFADDEIDNGNDDPEIVFVASCDGSSAVSDILEILPASVLTCALNSECNDFNLCTTDSCNPSNPLANGFGCVFANNALSCDDGVFCNGADICNSGVCGHAGDPCVAGETCFEPNICAPLTCKDIDGDGIPDYNATYCPPSSGGGGGGGGRDYCAWTNKSYLIGNNTAINSYLPDTNAGGLNISQIDSSNLVEHSNFMIEKANLARIRFRENLMLVRVNETGCFEKINFSEKLIKIEDKKVFVNSSYFVEMKKPAVIEFYGVNFVTPKVLKDGSDCGVDCSLNSYISGVSYSVNVSGFSTYEVVEGYVAPGTTPSGGSGGGGGGGGGGGTTPKLCTQSIKCDAWSSECVDGSQKRYCYDANACNKTKSYYEYKDCRASVEGTETGEGGILGGITNPTTRAIWKIVIFVFVGVMIAGLVVFIVLYLARRAKSGNKEVKMGKVLEDSKKFLGK